jgi:hypothetical protein
MRCETGDGVPIDPDTALRVILEGLVRFVIHDDAGVPVHWGREKRLFTGAAREAVMSLFHRCRNKGFNVERDRLGLWHTYRSDGTEVS